MPDKSEKPPGAGKKAKSAAKAKKSFVLNPPYADPEWPELSAEAEQVIMELLCSLLEPIGRHRSTFVVPSKGKRAKKRKRDAEKSNPPGATESATAATETTSVPPPPEVSRHVAVGFNSVVRCLDPLARQAINREPGATKDQPIVLTAVFVDRSSCAEILWSQLPFLAVAAALRTNSSQVRLVPLANGAFSRLTFAIGIPRATFIGIGQDAPGSQALTEYVAEHIAQIDIPWMKEHSAPKFKPTAVGLHLGPRAREQGNG